MLYKHAIPSIYPRNNESNEVGDKSPSANELNPIAEKNSSTEPNLFDGSDQEDFCGFDGEVLKNKLIDALMNGTLAGDRTNLEKKIEPDTSARSNTNQSDSQEIDDEIIFVENNVEVIEIDDDDDDDNDVEVIYFLTHSVILYTI